MSAITKDGIEVKPGQVWRDLDGRSNGRRVCVLSVSPNASPYPYATVRTGFTDRITKLRISRMHKSTRGYELVEDVPAH